MRNCLKPSEATGTKCCRLIETPIVCAADEQKTERRSKKVKFSQSDKHLFVCPVMYLRFTKCFNVMTSQSLRKFW